MKPADAITLIQKGIQTNRPQQWADLGCGSGTFTHALLKLLPPGSRITAVDQQMQRFEIPVDFVKANFEKDKLPLSGLDGILMANSIHYITNKRALIQKLETYLQQIPISCSLNMIPTALIRGCLIPYRFKNYSNYLMN